MLLVYTIVEPAAKYGWGAGRTLGLGAVAMALLVAFVVREATTANPLIPLRIFRSRNVSGANAVQALSVAGMFGMFFMGALYLQRVLGYDALQTGLAFLPATLVMACAVARLLGEADHALRRPHDAGPGPRADRRVARRCSRRRRSTASTSLHVLPVMVLLGAGAGIAFPALMTLAMSGATQQRRRPGLRPGQHDRAGRRRARPGRAGHAVGHPQRATWSRPAPRRPRR